MNAIVRDAVGARCPRFLHDEHERVLAPHRDGHDSPTRVVGEQRVRAWR